MENKNIFKTAQKIHFIGIGGIGISAIARMMLLEGKRVSGSDRDDTNITKELKKLGAKIYKGHRGSNLIKDTNLVVYTTAVNFSNPELKKAKKLKIPTLSYPEMLGLLSKDKYTIAVSGTHGKTTTTAMIAKILTDAKFSPTVIVGSLLKGHKSNFIAGKSKYLVCEACEYKRAFLNLSPKIIVITNIDNDHMDYYKSLRDIQKAFGQFAAKLGRDGVLICDTGDPLLASVIKKVRTKCRVIDYSEIRLDFPLKIPGGHNVKNARAASAVTGILGVNKKTIKKSLENYEGAWRRFEYKGKSKRGVLVYDDYAHHPTEIKATLRGTREFFGKRKVWCVFQPHLFSRTKILLEDFVCSFGDADEVIIVDVYAARETGDKIAGAKILAAKIKQCHRAVRYGGSFARVEKILKKNTKKGDIIITMGAGDVFKIGDNLLK